MSVEIFQEMIGAVIESITKTDDKLVFHASDGRNFKFSHSQNCCESVYIEDITGDLDDLIGSPLVEAELTSNIDRSGKSDLVIWSFYRYATAKGTVTVRWIGESNGYYSVSVSYKVEMPKVKETICDESDRSGMEFGCTFDRAEMDILIHAVMQLRKKVSSDPDYSGSYYEELLKLERKLVGLAYE